MLKAPQLKYYYEKEKRFMIICMSIGQQISIILENIKESFENQYQIHVNSQQ